MLFSCALIWKYSYYFSQHFFPPKKEDWLHHSAHQNRTTIQLTRKGIWLLTCRKQMWVSDDYCPHIVTLSYYKKLSQSNVKPIRNTSAISPTFLFWVHHIFNASRIKPVMSCPSNKCIVQVSRYLQLKNFFRLGPTSFTQVNFTCQSSFSLNTINLSQSCHTRIPSAFFNSTQVMQSHYT